MYVYMYAYNKYPVTVTVTVTVVDLFDCGGAAEKDHSVPWTASRILQKTLLK
jgi:hypothetical protein